MACSANLELQKKATDIRFLGEAYLAQGNFTSALKYFMDAEKLYPEDPYVQNDLGLAFMGKEQLDLAIGHFKKAVEIKPDYAPARNNLGAAYLAQEKWDAAIDEFKKITGDFLYATPHYPLSHLGWAYFNKQNYPLAVEYYLKALKESPGYSRALYGLGRTYLAMDKIPDAIGAFKKSVASDPGAAEIYFYLGAAYARSHEYAQALHAFNKVIELHRDSRLARQAEDEIRKIKAL